jgi:hypothetical protein
MAPGDCHWDEIHGFASPSEYKRFLDWIAEQVSTGEAQIVPAGKPVNRIAVMGERWFKCATCGSIWCLAPPDSPFRGFFALVN